MLFAQHHEQQQNLMAALDKLRLFCQAINDLSVSLMMLRRMLCLLTTSQVSEDRNNHQQWQQRVNQVFVPDGTFRTHASHQDGNHTRDFEVSAAVLGRYFAEYFRCGVKRMQVSVGGGELDNMIGNNEIPASFAYYFNEGTQV